ncbi:MAG: glycosyltransferase [Clostridia bacterium]|nr:glycosyltransferase [Clostridia bacterium]
MKVVYLGLLFCEESLQEAYKAAKGQVQIAPHAFQENLLSGMKKCVGTELAVINVPPIGSFPFNYKKLFSKTYRWGEENVQIGYLNVPVVKHWTQKRKIEKMLRTYLKTGEKICVVAYSLYEPFLQVIKKLKKKYANLTSCLILTDPVPGREDFDRFMTEKHKKRGDKLVSLAKSIDGFVLLTKYLAETAEVGERPFTVVECVGKTDQPACARNENPKNICLYAGVTNKAYGICELVEAFIGMENAELWVCGVGDAKEYLEATAQKYENIKYFGFVSRERVAQLQNECDFLINPRRPTGTYTKHSFPSKTVEYMMTAKPVIMYKLEGMPDEYDEYLSYLTGENTEAIKRELTAVFETNYNLLADKGQRAREFVLRNKNADVQAQKIVDFLNTCL